MGGIIAFMSNFNQYNNKSGGRRDFGGRGRNSDRASMHPAVCSSCGRDCQVPFIPTGSKPVYCSECFEKNGDLTPRRFSERSFDRSSSRDREMFDAVCDQCGANCKLPFRPTSGKPIYCSKCFEGKSSNEGRSFKQPQYEKQFDELSVKLDMIIKLLTPAVSKEAIQIEDLIEKPSEKKVKTKKKKAVKEEALA